MRGAHRVRFQPRPRRSTHRRPCGHHRGRGRRSGQAPHPRAPCDRRRACPRGHDEGPRLGPDQTSRSRRSPCRPDGLNVLRHSAATSLPRPCRTCSPSRLGIGPPIENGFYYDFGVGSPFDPDDLAAIEAAMKEIIKAGQRFRRREFPPSTLRAPSWRRAVQARADRHKSDRSTRPRSWRSARASSPSTTTSTARRARLCWSDLCRGPHLPSTKLYPRVQAARTAAAYWRGSENNPQLQRIYGTAWPTRDELKEHLPCWRRRLTRPPPHRRGTRPVHLRHRDRQGPAAVAAQRHGHPRRARGLGPVTERRLGYQRVVTPHITKEDLYYLSGHLPYYRRTLRPDRDRGRDVLPPADELPAPPHGLPARPRSYRDLPYDRRVRHGLPLRTQRPAAGHDADAGLHPERRPHLLHPRPGQGRVPRGHAYARRLLHGAWHHRLPHGARPSRPREQGQVPR